MPNPAPEFVHRNPRIEMAVQLDRAEQALRVAATYLRTLLIQGSELHECLHRRDSAGTTGRMLSTIRTGPR